MSSTEQPESSANYYTPTSKIKYYLFRFDWVLSRFFLKIFNVFIFISIICIGLFSLATELENIFKYQEGIADISNVELLFLISFLILIKRYWSYTKRTSLRWWVIVTTPFIWFGKLMLIGWIVFFFSIIYAVMTENTTIDATNYLLILFDQTENYWQLFTFFCILASLYISIPSYKLRIISEKKTPQNQEVENDY